MEESTPKTPANTTESRPNHQSNRPWRSLHQRPQQTQRRTTNQRHDIQTTYRPNQNKIQTKPRQLRTIRPQSSPNRTKTRSTTNHHRRYRPPRNHQRSKRHPQRNNNPHLKATYISPRTLPMPSKETTQCQKQTPA